MFDLEKVASGNIRKKLVPYMISHNAKIVKESQKFIRQRLPKNIADAMEKGAIYYPESTKCTEKASQ